MIDIHTHVLPFIDDGSSSIEESIKILKEAKKCGITSIVATPHFKDNCKASINKIKKSYESIYPYSKELGIDLYIGQEIKYFGDDLKLVLDGKLLTLNNTKLVLLEFDTRKEDDVSDVVYSYYKKGFVPVVAHVERYLYCLDLSVISDIKKCGGLIQINASSILGKAGRKVKNFVLELIKYGYVDFVASDVHIFREYDMLKAYNIVKEKFSVDVANDIFINHQNYFLFSGYFNLKD